MLLKNNSYYVRLFLKNTRNQAKQTKKVSATQCPKSHPIPILTTTFKKQGSVCHLGEGQTDYYLVGPTCLHPLQGTVVLPQPINLLLFYTQYTCCLLMSCSPGTWVMLLLRGGGGGGGVARDSE